MASAARTIRSHPVAETQGGGGTLTRASSEQAVQSGMDGAGGVHSGEFGGFDSSGGSRVTLFMVAHRSGQEPRWLRPEVLVAVGAVVVAQRNVDVSLVPGAGHGDVEQPSLILQAVAGC